MSKKNKNIFINDIEVPQIVQKKADFAFSKIRREGQTSVSHEKTRKKGQQYKAVGKLFKRQVAIIVGSCILGIGTVSIAAVAYHFWSRGMQGNLQATDIQQEELLENEFVTILEKEPNYDSMAVTMNNITIKPIETIVDGHFAYLTFSVEGYEYELDNKKEPAFESVLVYIGDNKGDEDNFLNMSGSFYDGIVAGTDGIPIYDDGEALKFDEEGNLISRFLTEDGTLEYVIAAYSSNIEESLIDKTIHVEFKNLGTAYKAQYENAVDGEWDFALTLSGQDATTQYYLNEELGESGAIVNSVQLSPISIRVNYSFTGGTTHEVGLDENGTSIDTEMFTTPPEFCGVKLKDGTLLPYLSNGGMSSYTDDSLKEYYSLIMFDRVIDTGQVDSLLFKKDSGNGDATLTEENLYIVPIQKLN